MKGALGVDVDWTRCAGHGVCAASLSELITRDQWGFPIVHGSGEVPPPLVGAARTAAATCPALALRLRRAPDG